TILGMTTVEAAVIGVLGTVAGIAGGYGLLSWLAATTIPNVMPEIGITVTLTAGSILAALLLGLGAVSVAPLFMGRRRRRGCGPALRWAEGPPLPAIRGRRPQPRCGARYAVARRGGEAAATRGAAELVRGTEAALTELRAMLSGQPGDRLVVAPRESWLLTL